MPVDDLIRATNTPEISESRMFRKIMREMAPWMTVHELHVLMWIFDRTYTYGKTFERIPMDHFLNGVWLGQERIHPPVGLKKSRLYECLQTLLENVFIIQSKRHRTDIPSYAINPVWQPSAKYRHGDYSGIPDKLLRDTGHTTPGCETINKRNIEKRDIQQVAPALTRDAMPAPEDGMFEPKERLKAQVAAALQKTGAARDKRKGKASATGYMKIWQDAFNEHYPDDTFFAWRVYEQSAFKKAIARGVPAEAVTDFINYVVEHFAQVLNGPLVWMRSKPTLPEVGFVTKHIDKFYQSFTDHRDPNRRLRRRISEVKPAPKPKTKVRNREDQQEIEALRAEVASLKNSNARLASGRRRKVKKLIKAPPKAGRGDKEFGRWED